MTYDATVKLCYINNTEATISSKYFPEIVDKHSITIEAPAQDMNVYQHFELFKAFLRAMDFAEYSIMDGACRLAFNDSNDGEQMKKLMNEYELQDKQYHTDDEYYALKEEVRELKEKLARVLPEQYKEWNGLVPGSDQACRAGCKCPVMDNAEMPNDRKWVNGDCPLHGKVK